MCEICYVSSDDLDGSVVDIRNCGKLGVIKCNKRGFVVVLLWKR